MYLAKNLLKDKSFFLAYGDVLSNINPKSLLELKSQNTEITNLTCVHPNSHPEDSDLIELGDNNLITNSLKKDIYLNAVNIKLARTLNLYLISENILWTGKFVILLFLKFLSLAESSFPFTTILDSL